MKKALYDSARVFVDAVLARDPVHAAALSVRGDLFYRAALFTTRPGEDTILLQRADADLRRATMLEGTRPEAWLALSTVQSLRGQVAASLVSAKRAIENDAFLVDGETAYFNLYAGALLSQRFTEALQWCRRGRLVYAGEPEFYECELTLLRDRPAQADDEQVAWNMVHLLDSLSTLPGRKPRQPYALPYRLIVAAGVSARAGSVARARDALARAQRLVAPDSTQRLDFAFDEPWVHLMLGDKQRAVRQRRALMTERVSIALVRQGRPGAFCQLAAAPVVVIVSVSAGHANQRRCEPNQSRIEQCSPERRPL